jgi:hypothetical protein
MQEQRSRADRDSLRFATHAAGWAAAAVVAGLALAEAAAFAVRTVGGPTASPGQTARAGGLLFQAFHGTPVRFDAVLRAIGPRVGGSVRVSLGAAPTLGTVVVVAILFLAGRRLAGEDGSGVRGCLRGAAVAVPYGVMCAIVALVSRLHVPAPGTSRALIVGSIAVEAPIAWSFALGIAVAAVAGFVGGLTAAGQRALGANDLGFGGGRVASNADGPRQGHFGAAVWAGAVWIFIGLVASFAALLGLAIADGRSRTAYFDGAFAHGTARGLASLGLTLLWLPTLCAWVLQLSMGSCVATHAGCSISYWHVPGSIAELAGAQPARPTHGPPGIYALFVLVPLVTSLAGGWLGAHRAGARRGAKSAFAGSRAGLVFGLLTVPVVLLARLWTSVEGPGATVVGGGRTLSLGPAVLLSASVGLLWGLAGGAAGGLLRSVGRRRSTPPVRERVFPQIEARVPDPTSADDRSPD